MNSALIAQYIVSRNWRALYFELGRIKGDKRPVVLKAAKSVPAMRLVDFIIEAIRHIYTLEKQLDSATGDPYSLDPEL
jgi:hypothetical protein